MYGTLLSPEQRPLHKLKTLMVGHGGSSASSYLADPTSPKFTLSWFACLGQVGDACLSLYFSYGAVACMIVCIIGLACSVTGFTIPGFVIGLVGSAMMYNMGNYVLMTHLFVYRQLCIYVHASIIRCALYLKYRRIYSKL